MPPTPEYTHRMNKVLDHIDRHLAGPIDLTTLAEVAHFSPFHFHRLFAAWTGETLGDYLRRRRLEKGAKLLMHRRRQPVLDIALDVGFGSGEAFARAFKLHFGMTPTAWRRGKGGLAARDRAGGVRNPDQSQRKMNQVYADGLADHGRSFPQEPIMDINIVTLPPARVAYMRHIGPYGPRVTELWLQRFLPWRQAQGLDNSPCYGIGHDDPHITPADKCRYDACVAVPDDFVAQGPVSIANLPGGRYAVADFKGDGPAIGEAWTTLLRDWLPASGMQPDGRPFFEYYPTKACYDPKTGIFECQICLPVKPL